MTTLLQDTFTRANVASGWGTATDGNTWTIQSGNGQSVASNEGQVSSSTSSTFATLGNALSTADVEGLVRFQAKDILHNTAGILLRWTDASNHWLARYNGAASPSAGINVMVKVSGTYTSQATITKTISGTNFYWLRFRCQGTTISIKLWQDGNTEPASWDGQYTVSSQNVAGKAGLYGFANSTNLTLYDSFSVSDLSTHVTHTASGVTAQLSVHNTHTASGVAAQLNAHPTHTASGVTAQINAHTTHTATGVTAQLSAGGHQTHTASGVTAQLKVHNQHTASGLTARLSVHNSHTASGLTAQVKSHPSHTASGVTANVKAHPTHTASGVTAQLSVTNAPGTGIGDLAVSTKSQTWSGGPTGSPGTETDITYTDSANSGWTLGIIPSYGGMLLSPWYAVDSGVTGANQTSLTTSAPDGAVHWLDQSPGAVFAGSEDVKFANAGGLTELAPTGTAFRRYYKGIGDANDANGFQWTAYACIYPGDPGLVALRFDLHNPSGSPISLNATDSLEIALIGGLQQTDSTWTAANGKWNTLGGTEATWASTLTNGDPDYTYITPANGGATNIGRLTVKHTSLSGLGWTSLQNEYLANASRLKFKVQGSQSSIAAGATETVYLLYVLRRNLTSSDAAAIAADYLSPGTPTATVGSYTSYSYDERAYVHAASGSKLTTTLDLSPAHVTARYKPIIKLTGWNTGGTPILTWGGASLTNGVDYRYVVDSANGVLYVQLYFDVVTSGAGAGQRNNAALAITHASTTHTASGVTAQLSIHHSHTASGVTAQLQQHTTHTASGLTAQVQAHNTHTASGVTAQVSVHHSHTAAGLTAQISAHNSHTASGVSAQLSVNRQSGRATLAIRAGSTATLATAATATATLTTSTP